MNLIKIEKMESINTAQITSEENLLKFKKALKDKVNQGFEIEERNDKLPFAVLFRKAKKVNHIFNLRLFFLTLGLWSLVWVYLVWVSLGEKRILIAIDEDGNAFEDKCFN
jgi:ABC-type microcin C transport system permease subunit YejB